MFAARLRAAPTDKDRSDGETIDQRAERLKGTTLFQLTSSLSMQSSPRRSAGIFRHCGQWRSDQVDDGNVERSGGVARRSRSSVGRRWVTSRASSVLYADLEGEAEIIVGDIEQLQEDLEDLKNVEDVEEDVATTGELFSISSFGVDYPVETLVSRMEKKLFYIPPFQRAFVWSQNQCSRFIESLLLGLPVPGIFLFKEADSGKHLVIDGQQRLKSLLYFSEGLINGKEFVLTGLETKFDGRTYKTLDDADRARLDDAVIHATVFKQDLPEGEINSVYEVFERINTGGIKLSPQEIRSCICHGNFNDYLHKLNDNAEWRALYGPKSKRLKDVELILRFMAFYEKGDAYKGPMKHFLNDYMKEKRNLSDEQLQTLADIFSRTVGYVTAALGKRAFRPDRSLNTAVFDAVASAIAHRLSAKAPPEYGVAAATYDALLQNERFVEGYIRATADEENVKKRMEEAGKAFANV